MLLLTPELDAVAHFAANDQDERERKKIEAKWTETMKVKAIAVPTRSVILPSESLDAHLLVKAIQRYCLTSPKTD